MFAGRLSLCGCTTDQFVISGRRMFIAFDNSLY
jgi:hypothetical protein